MARPLTHRALAALAGLLLLAACAHPLSAARQRDPLIDANVKTTRCLAESGQSEALVLRGAGGQDSVNALLNLLRFPRNAAILVDGSDPGAVAAVVEAALRALPAGAGGGERWLCAVVARSDEVLLRPLADKAGIRLLWLK